MTTWPPRPEAEPEAASGRGAKGLSAEDRELLTSKLAELKNTSEEDKQQLLDMMAANPGKRFEILERAKQRDELEGWKAEEAAARSDTSRAPGTVRVRARQR